MRQWEIYGEKCWSSETSRCVFFCWCLVRPQIPWLEPGSGFGPPYFFFSKSEIDCCNVWSSNARWSTLGTHQFGLNQPWILIILDTNHSWMPKIEDVKRKKEQLCSATNLINHMIKQPTDVQPTSGETVKPTNSSGQWERDRHCGTSAECGGGWHTLCSALVDLTELLVVKGQKSFQESYVFWCLFLLICWWLILLIFGYWCLIFAFWYVCFCFV